MTKEEVLEKLNEFKDYKGILVINLIDGNSYPCKFQTSHLNRLDEVRNIEENNEWLIDVIPGFGQGWQQKIKGDEVKNIQSSF